MRGVRPVFTARDAVVSVQVSTGSGMRRRGVWTPMGWKRSEEALDDVSCQSAILALDRHLSTSRQQINHTVVAVLRFKFQQGNELRLGHLWLSPAAPSSRTRTHHRHCRAC
uniref:Uncharacterized protein n=1 Tax=Mycena chlorophos TaxID=658473 RepID=A0ABQ0LX23_MYCCL|nr:predicted protein [Mycena chlorophos]